MNRIVLDAETRSKLLLGKVTVEITDEQGTVVGHFLPADAYDRMVELLFPPVTKEEIAEARREMLQHGGVSSEELLAGLAQIKRNWEARQ